MTDVVRAGEWGAPELPGSAWAAGCAFLAAQVVGLARRGLTDAAAPWPLVSMALSGAVVGWFAAGVLRARPIRTAVVWVILIVTLVLQVFGVLVDPGGWIELAVSVVPLVLLARFCRSRFYNDQRVFGARATDVRPAIGGVLALAVITGAFGGITAASSGDTAQLRIGL